MKKRSQKRTRKKSNCTKCMHVVKRFHFQSIASIHLVNSGPFALNQLAFAFTLENAI